MTPEEARGFFARRHELDMERHVELDFTFECAGDPRLAAARLASEQSTTQWRRVGWDEDYRPRFAAKVLSVEAHARPEGWTYCIPNAPSGPVHACRVTLAHPHENFGPRFPNMMTSIIGEGTYYAPGIPFIRLEDVRFPATYLAQFAGPKLGLDGLRARLQAYDRPIFLGVIKPNLGMAPADFAAIGEQGLLGGLDIAKDDEMLSDAPWSPVAERAHFMGAACARAERATGERKLYMASITDEVPRLPALHDAAVGAGAGALLINVMPVGLSGVRHLCAHARVPVFGHFPFNAAFARLPLHGVHSRVVTKLQRLAGVDAVIMPGFGARMMMAEHEVLECVRACTEPMANIRPVLPIPGGSDWAGTLEPLFRRVGSVDFGFVPGRGVFNHPMGPAAGARSIRLAWEGIRRGEPLGALATRHEEVRRAIEAFGG